MFPLLFEHTHTRTQASTKAEDITTQTWRTTWFCCFLFEIWTRSLFLIRARKLWFTNEDAHQSKVVWMFCGALSYFKLVNSRINSSEMNHKLVWFNVSFRVHFKTSKVFPSHIHCIPLQLLMFNQKMQEISTRLIFVDSGTALYVLALGITVLPWLFIAPLEWEGRSEEKDWKSDSLFLFHPGCLIRLFLLEEHTFSMPFTPNFPHNLKHTLSAGSLVDWQTNWAYFILSSSACRQAFVERMFQNSLLVTGLQCVMERTDFEVLSPDQVFCWCWALGWAAVKIDFWGTYFQIDLKLNLCTSHSGESLCSCVCWTNQIKAQT